MKGNKVRHTIEASSEPDFYHPAWENHFEASYPPKLLELQCAAVVKALCDKAMTDARIKTAPIMMQIPSVVAEKETSSFRSGSSSKKSDQVMILPRLPVPSTAPMDPPHVVSSMEFPDVAVSAPEDSIKDGDVLTFEGIPFHYLDGHNDDFHSSAMSVLGTEDDNFSISSMRRFVSSSFVGSVDSFHLDQDPHLYNLTAV